MRRFANQYKSIKRNGLEIAGYCYNCVMAMSVHTHGYPLFA